MHIFQGVCKTALGQSLIRDITNLADKGRFSLVFGKVLIPALSGGEPGVAAVTKVGPGGILLVFPDVSLQS